MSSRYLSVGVLVVACAAVGSIAASAADPAAPEAQTSAVESTAKGVLSALHATNEANIQVGNLAQERGSSEQVRDLGKTLVADHQSLDQKVLALATQKGINLVTRQNASQPSSLGALGETVVAATAVSRLKGLSGGQFDQAFLSTVAKGSQGTLAQLTKAKTSVPDADVQQLIEGAIPTLKAHQTAAAQASTSSSEPPQQ